MFWVYILRCADGSFYTGHTDDIDRRFAEHEQGLNPKCYTAQRLPVQLVYLSSFSTRLDALASEQQIKGWSRAKKEALIQEDWVALTRLARNRQQSDF